LHGRHLATRIGQVHPDLSETAPADSSRAHFARNPTLVDPPLGAVMDFVWIVIGIILGAGGMFAFTYFAGRSAIAQARTEAEKNLDDLESRLGTRDKLMTQKEQQLEGVLKEQRDRLLQMANMSAEQAKEMLLKRIEDECRRDAGALIQEITEKAQEEAKDKSR